MKKYMFYLNPQIPAVRATEEIVEFDDDVTEKEVQDAFTEWVFDKLDTAIIELRRDQCAP